MYRTALFVLLLLLVACGGGTPRSSPSAAPAATTAAPPSPSRVFPSPTAAEAKTEAATPTLPAPTVTASPVAQSPAPATASPSGLPDPELYTWQAVASGLDAPLGLTNAGDGSGRIFILEQAGEILILKNGAVLPEPFLDIRERIASGGERGLLGLAFHPGYPSTGFFFVNYTDLLGNTVIARFQVSPQDPDRALPDSEIKLLQVEQPYANHNGGSLVFGPDGYLYLGLGDGGSAGDPHGNAQSLNTLLGKILRIDVNHGNPYAIPPDNPFHSPDQKPEIWAYGLRNPWRIAFDPANGDLYIGDVGQNAWEEIDYLPAGSPGGANFGWNYLEGTHPFRDQNEPQGLNLIPPVAEYSHSLGCSVTGGVVYRGENLPAWQGVYLYGDYCSGNVWGLRRNSQAGAGQAAWQDKLLFQLDSRISSFGEDEQGEIYLVDLSGAIYQLANK